MSRVLRVEKSCAVKTKLFSSGHCSQVSTPPRQRATASHCVYSFSSVRRCLVSSLAGLPIAPATCCGAPGEGGQAVPRWCTSLCASLHVRSFDDASGIVCECTPAAIGSYAGERNSSIESHGATSACRGRSELAPRPHQQCVDASSPTIGLRSQNSLLSSGLRLSTPPLAPSPQPAQHAARTRGSR